MEQLIGSVRTPPQNESNIDVGTFMRLERMIKQSTQKIYNNVLYPYIPNPKIHNLITS